MRPLGIELGDEADRRPVVVGVVANVDGVAGGVDGADVAVARKAVRVGACRSSAESAARRSAPGSRASACAGCPSATASGRRRARRRGSRACRAPRAPPAAAWSPARACRQVSKRIGSPVSGLSPVFSVALWHICTRSLSCAKELGSGNPAGSCSNSSPNVRSAKRRIHTCTIAAACESAICCCRRHVLVDARLGREAGPALHRRERRRHELLRDRARLLRQQRQIGVRARRLHLLGERLRRVEERRRQAPAPTR